jgi:hypothetical protein
MADVFKVKKSRESGNTCIKSKGTLDSLHQTHVETLKRKMDPQAIKDLEQKLEKMKLEKMKIPIASFDFEHVLRLSQLEKDIERLKLKQKKRLNSQIRPQSHI